MPLELFSKGGAYVIDGTCTPTPIIPNPHIPPFLHDLGKEALTCTPTIIPISIPSSNFRLNSSKVGIDAKIL
jgi:hypothetical protein